MRKEVDKLLKKTLKKVKEVCPLIHNITNYVTVNDCANILLACGASPIMADDIAEVEEITSICGGLTINIGTLNERTIESMILAGRKSNLLNHSVVLDPVGVGASKFRTNTVEKLLKEIQFTAIHGNVSELKALAIGSSSTTGVDANINDKITQSNIQEVVQLAKNFSKESQAIIIVTGAIDIVCDANQAYIIKNGHPMMSKVSGTGCMLSTMITAYLTANPDDKLLASATAVILMGLAGELAFNRLSEYEGNLTYRDLIIDEIYNMDGNILEQKAKYKIC